MGSTQVFRALTIALLTALCASQPDKCSGPPPTAPDYSAVMARDRTTGLAFDGLPGFTRSVYQREYAVVTPESRVWASAYGWTNTLTAHIITPASGAHFSMYLADLRANAEVPHATGAERFVAVLTGSISLGALTLGPNHYAYFPPNTTEERITSQDGASLLVYERVYRAQGTPKFLHGDIEALPLLPTSGEVFDLRKALPMTADYDFNVHIMDFQPGQYLAVKEAHYNQHGMLILEGQGIYRLANDWYPVQAGDAIWMSPFVLQWYAALGSTRTRYILYKDTAIDPLFS